MKLDPRMLVAPLVAILVLGLTTYRTFGALRNSGMWQPKPKTPAIRAEDPYARLDLTLSKPLLVAPADRARNPFVFGAAPVQVAVRPATTPRPKPVVVAPERPVLTSIVWDADPRATIRYRQKDFSVRQNSLFADFRVASITNTQVVLDRNGEPLVLTLRKGD
jgi:hypothetical protein